MLRVAILSVGDELVTGQTVDTNSAWLSQQLSAIGAAVVSHATVGDDQAMIESAIRRSAEDADAIVISGGIGPTEDDLTRQAVAAVLGTELELNEGWLAKLKEFWARRGAVMPEMNRIQAMIPRGATIIENTAGTAAGVRATLAGRVDLFSTPGVPKEMKVMFQRDVLPHLAARSAGAALVVRNLHTFGMGESAVAERLGTLMDRKRNPTVGTTVSGGIVSVRVYSKFESRSRALDELAATESLVRGALGNLVFGADDDVLQAVVAKLLAERKASVTTAESCTGGLVSKMLTDVPGSSAYFKQGWVVYANQAKYERLGVNLEMLNVYGAVSEPVATAMARNARRLAKADFSLAVSGIAGPDGGSATKPVGTVCIALAKAAAGAPRRFDDSEVLVRTFNFPGDREMIRDRSAKMALTLLRYELLGERAPF
jgi:nicotinamide-nucleotide amidase